MRSNPIRTLAVTFIVICTCAGIGFLGAQLLWPEPVDEVAERASRMSEELQGTSEFQQFRQELDRKLGSLAELPEFSVSKLESAASGSSRGDHDSEWATFPRTPKQLHMMLKGGFQLLDAAELYRNRNLNPVDEYIAKAHRTAIAACIERYQVVDKELAQSESDATEREVTLAIERGVGERIEGKAVPHAFMPKEYQRQVAEQLAARGELTEQLGDCMVFPKVDGSTHITRFFGDHGIAVPLTALPQTRAVREARAFVATELGGALLACFTSLGLMSGESAMRHGHVLVESLTAVAQAR